MPETEASATTDKEEGYFDNLTAEDIKQLLTDIKTEAEAAVKSGDQQLEKWARSTGLFASILLHTTGDKKPAPVPAPADTKTTDTKTTADPKKV